MSKNIFPEFTHLHILIVLGDHRDLPQPWTVLRHNRGMLALQWSKKVPFWIDHFHLANFTTEFYFISKMF